MFVAGVGNVEVVTFGGSACRGAMGVSAAVGLEGPESWQGCTKRSFWRPDALPQGSNNHCFNGLYQRNIVLYTKDLALHHQLNRSFNGL